MRKLNTFIRLLATDRAGLKKSFAIFLGTTPLTRWLPDTLYLKHQYHAFIGHKLNLSSPIGFNEKLQWLKLYNRDPFQKTLVDKQAVKEYIAETIGEEYVIPTLGVYAHFDDIDFDTLPDQFVLKCTHDSGSTVVCNNKATFNTAAARKKLTKKLKQNLFWWGREWPYKDVQPQIIAEAYMEDANGRLDDYKFMCFNGQVKCSFVCTDRFSDKGLHITFFDPDWNVMPFERSYPAVKEGLPKPSQYEKMVELAQTLSKGIPFVRVDFYEADGKIYFGEMTFYPGCGFEAFQPEQWDKTLGDWITLPPKP